MEKLWRNLRKLKRDFPLNRVVSVRTYTVLTDSDGNRLYGCMDKINEEFKICLLRHDDVSIMIDTLWHEWTHALLWPRCRFRHSKQFWQTYGKIYALYQD